MFFLEFLLVFCGLRLGDLHTAGILCAEGGKRFNRRGCGLDDLFRAGVVAVGNLEAYRFAVDVNVNNGLDADMLVNLLHECHF